MWQSHLEFKERVQDWWNIRIDGTAMYRLTLKLDNIRRNVRVWAKSSFGDFFKVKGEMEEKLKKIQGQIAEGTNLEGATQEDEYRKMWKDILLREKIFWK